MLCLTILLLNGCDSDANRSDHVSTGLFITTDKTEYLRNEKTIITFINNTDQTVIFEGCLSDIFIIVTNGLKTNGLSGPTYPVQTLLGSNLH